MKLITMFGLVFQVAVMLGDIIVFGVAILVVGLAQTNPLAWILSGALLWRWWKTGGLMAWKPDNIRAFMHNIKLGH